MNMIAFGFLLLEKLRGRKKFRVDPAFDRENDPKAPAGMDRDMPGLQQESQAASFGWFYLT